MTDPQQHVRPIAPIVHLSLPSGGFCNQVDDCQAEKIARISNTFFLKYLLIVGFRFFF